MHSIRLDIQDNVFDKVIYFLNNLPKNDVKIIENNFIEEDWSHLESEIDKGLSSGISDKSHEEIINHIKRKYV
ncbi:MAG: hypothetical protein COA44_02705 [Arcobacter sp.]|nr:MAG: hypothetical protein COA44_02705 [Arcobacter sp.]